MEDTLHVKGRETTRRWRKDWNLFAKEALGANLDQEQKDILHSVQFNKMTSVASGTSRGKDYVAAVAALCFLYLTPKWTAGVLTENTKVAMTAPTLRQVKDIMMPEISRLWNNALRRKVDLPGQLNAFDIRMDDPEWFLTGFKSDEYNHEAWSGFHAANTMFVVTEASGIHQSIFDAIEGNLQGNSRLLIVFNPNATTGYAAQSQKSKRWVKFRLNSLNAQNVVEKKVVIPGQVDYAWVADKVEHWCTRVPEPNEGEGDFKWEGQWYRPSDLFRIKVLGLFPKESEDTLIPAHWIDLANERWNTYTGVPANNDLRLGVDVAGMGRDSSCFCPRYVNYVAQFEKIQSGGKANHMEIAGITLNKLRLHPGEHAWAMIDTIGEGAGVYSRLEEQKDLLEQSGAYAVSCKYSEAARTESDEDLKDVTEQYTFANMRAYLHWAVRDWLNPANKTGAMLPPDDELKEEATAIKWKFQSNGRIIIEPKDDIKTRLKRSPDKFDSLANTFKPVEVAALQDVSGFFF